MRFAACSGSVDSWCTGSGRAGPGTFLAGIRHIHCRWSFDPLGNPLRQQTATYDTCGGSIPCLESIAPTLSEVWSETNDDMLQRDVTTCLRPLTQHWGKASRRKNSDIRYTWRCTLPVSNTLKGLVEQKFLYCFPVARNIPLWMPIHVRSNYVWCSLWQPIDSNMPSQVWFLEWSWKRCLQRIFRHVLYCLIKMRSS